jgi:hypothetical protein
MIKWIKRNIRYASYIIRHKYFVAQVCIGEGLYREAITHDLSKLLPSEWVPYREYFYGEAELNIMDRISPFDYAWLKHQKRNTHHWQAWVLIQDDGEVIPLQMSERAYREMVCDWYGAGKAINGDGSWHSTYQWFINNYKKMILHPKTFNAVESMLLLKEYMEDAQKGRKGANMSQARRQANEEVRMERHVGVRLWTKKNKGAEH